MTPTTTQEKTTTTAPTSVPYLMGTAWLVTLETHCFGNSRKLRKSQYEVDGADKEDTSANRKLLRSPELEEIRSLMGKARGFLDDEALEFPMLGVNMIPIKKVPDVRYQLDDFKRRILEAVGRFKEHYEERVAEHKARNPKVHNPLDYPPKEALDEEFVFRYQFIAITAPENGVGANRVDPSIIEEAKRQTAGLWKEAAEQTRIMQAEVMMQLVEKLKEKLEDDGSGKPRRFNSSTVDNLKDFMRQFENSTNVTNFAQLEDLVKRGRKLLDGTSAGDLKDSAMLRNKVRTDLAAIASQLEPLVGERKVRSKKEF